jgi:LmbE family N-acetylglucosaminyl deacetylase
MINWKAHKILVIAPHLDDVELGMGAILNQMSECGAEIFYIGLSMPHHVDEVTFMHEFWNSQSFYRIPKENYFMYQFDPRDLFSRRIEILQLFYDFNQTHKPTIVFIPSSTDIHQSHEVVFEEARRAFKYSSILGYELPWNQFTTSSNFFVELRPQDVKCKQDAINCFLTQKDRSFFGNDILIDLAKVRGKQVEVEFAECFEVVRWVSRV